MGVPQGSVLSTLLFSLLHSFVVLRSLNSIVISAVDAVLMDLITKSDETAENLTWWCWYNSLFLNTCKSVRWGFEIKERTDVASFQTKSGQNELRLEVFKANFPEKFTTAVEQLCTTTDPCDYIIGWRVQRNRLLSRRNLVNFSS